MESQEENPTTTHKTTDTDTVVDLYNGTRVGEYSTEIIH
ncbi:Unannotated [Lentimonas sp. CC4]|nr:Unannotated [Lentimonas sp. CC4]CAA6686375.1 Unannotated [Lentimonas sp. CC6]CAA7076149.1 Unannotated [Lentimonas sp. CC4]CAA7170858.1 Unannotated [Lentimonas sp. CC21]CAA7181200.1 Unannotated [Lentimonas sp. CC8]